MSLGEKNVHISTIPFPTVTVCPEVKITYAKWDEYDLNPSFLSELTDPQ